MKYIGCDKIGRGNKRIYSRTWIGAERAAYLKHRQTVTKNCNGNQNVRALFEMVIYLPFAGNTR